MNFWLVMVCVLCAPLWAYFFSKLVTMGFYVGRHRATKLIRKLSYYESATTTASDDGRV